MPQKLSFRLGDEATGTGKDVSWVLVIGGLLLLVLLIPTPKRPTLPYASLIDKTHALNDVNSQWLALEKSIIARLETL